MVLGNPGIVTLSVIATSSFANANGFKAELNDLVLAAGNWLIWFLPRRRAPAIKWEDFAKARLQSFKPYEDNTTIDKLLHLEEGYGVVRSRLLEKSPFIGQSLSVINKINNALTHSFILGIEHDRAWISAPKLTEILLLDDYRLLYRQLGDLAEHFG